MKDPSSPGSESDLHAWVDDRLPDRERRRVDDRLAGDPTAAETARAWAQQRDLLRGLHEDLLHDPIPPSLLAAAQQAELRGRGIQAWQRWGGQAASVLLAFGAGWIGHELWQADRGGPRLGGPADFGRQALAAHAVYSPEVRHPVEVEAAQHEHLVKWLSNRLGRPIKVPDLRSQGFELVGGRLLPGESGARAQFMYQSAAGQRITLYLGAMPARESAGGETAFRFTAQGEDAGFYWVDQGFGYALAGRLPRARLLGLAEAVYRQL